MMQGMASGALFSEQRQWGHAQRGSAGNAGKRDAGSLPKGQGRASKRPKTTRAKRWVVDGGTHRSSVQYTYASVSWMGSLLLVGTHLCMSKWPRCVVLVHRSSVRRRTGLEHGAVP